MPIKNVDIDRMRSEKIYFDKRRSIFGSTEVRMDMITNRKVLYISSPFLFHNNTNVSVQVKFGEASSDRKIVLGEDFTLRPKNSAPVPIDCSTKCFQMCLTDKNGVDFRSGVCSIPEHIRVGKKLDVTLQSSG